MKRFRLSVFLGSLSTLLVWLGANLLPPVAYLLFPGEAASSVLFGREHPALWALTLLIVNSIVFAVVIYVSFCLSSYFRMKNRLQAPVR
jgi:hypothetical protein